MRAHFGEARQALAAAGIAVRLIHAKLGVKIDVARHCRIRPLVAIPP